MNRWLKLAFVSLAAVMLIASAACGKSSSAPGALKDDLGRTIQLKSTPQRIVSLAPSNTEILFAIGAGDKVVGVDNSSDYPAAAKTRETVGDPFPAFNLETIVSLKPDLVIAFGYGSQPPQIVDQLQSQGIQSLVLAPKTVDDIYADITLVGKATGYEKQAAGVVADMKQRVDAVVAKTKNASRPRVYYEMDATVPTAPWTAGPGSFTDALIQMGGGTNIGASGLTTAFQISTEQILKEDPQVMLLASAQYGTTVDSVKGRPGWGGLSAAKDNKIYPLSKDISDLTDRCGPRFALGVEAIAKMIHPELFQ